jgi:hypothetical protein
MVYSPPPELTTSPGFTSGTPGSEPNMVYDPVDGIWTTAYDMEIRNQMRAEAQPTVPSSPGFTPASTDTTGNYVWDPVDGIWTTPYDMEIRDEMRAQAQAPPPAPIPMQQAPFQPPAQWQPTPSYMPQWTQDYFEPASPIEYGPPVGPAGRTYDQVLGTEYLSDAERAWFLRQQGRYVDAYSQPQAYTPEELQTVQALESFAKVQNMLARLPGQLGAIDEYEAERQARRQYQLDLQVEQGARELAMVAQAMKDAGLALGLSDDELLRIAEARITAAGSAAGALETIAGIQEALHGPTLASRGLEAAVMWGAGAPVVGAGFIPNILGRGALSLGQYGRLALGAEAGMLGGEELGRQQGAPPLLAGLGGALAGGAAALVGPGAVVGAGRALARGAEQGAPGIRAAAEMAGFSLPPEPVVGYRARQPARQEVRQELSRLATPDKAIEAAGEPIFVARERLTASLSDLEVRPSLFQARDADAGLSVSSKRVNQLVRDFDPAQFTPPSVVPDPDNPGKYIIYRGHHRTEAFKRVYGPNAPIEVQVANVDIRNPDALRLIQLEGDASNFKTALPNFRETVRAVERAEAAGLSVDDIAGRLRKSAGEIRDLQDSARLGASVIDRVTLEPALGPYAAEIGRGMRLYKVGVEDANGWFNRIANPTEGKRPTVTAVRDTVDRFGKQFASLPSVALFDVDMVGGARGGLLGAIDAHARLRTDLEAQIREAKRTAKLAQKLATSPSARKADVTAANRLAATAQREQTRIQKEITANNRNVMAAFREAQSVSPSRALSSAETSRPPLRMEETSVPGLRQAPSIQSSETARLPSSTTRVTRESIQTGPRTTLGAEPVGIGGSSEVILHQFNDSEDLLRLAGQSQSRLDGSLAEIPNTSYVGSRVKATERLGEKLAGRQPNEVSDYLGARLVTDDIEGAVREVGQRFRIVRDRPTSYGDTGYLGRHLQVDMGNGFSAEIQVLTPRQAAGQEYAHALYNRIRGSDVPLDELQRLQAASRYIFDNTPPISHERAAAIQRQAGDRVAEEMRVVVENAQRILRGEEPQVVRTSLFGDVPETTFASERELAGFREAQGRLAMGAGELSTETAGPLFAQAPATEAAKPAAQVRAASQVPPETGAPVSQAGGARRTPTALERGATEASGPPRRPGGPTPPAGGMSEGDAVMALRQALRQQRGVIQEREAIVSAGRRRQAAGIGAGQEAAGAAGLSGREAAAQARAGAAGRILPEEGLGFSLSDEAVDALIDKANRMSREGSLGRFEYINAARALDEGRTRGLTRTQARLLSKLSGIDESAFEPLVKARKQPAANLQAADERAAKAALDEMEAWERQRGMTARTVRSIRAEDARSVDRALKAQLKAAESETRTLQRLAADIDARWTRDRRATERQVVRELAHGEKRAIRTGAASEEQVDKFTRQLLQKARENPKSSILGRDPGDIGQFAEEIVRYWRRGVYAEIDNLADAGALQDIIRGAAAQWTGDLTDSVANKAIHARANLISALVHDGLDPAIARKVADAETRRMIVDRHGGKVGKKLWGEIERVIVRQPTLGKEEQIGGFTQLMDRWKATKFGTFDPFGVIGVNLLPALQKGNFAAFAGGVNRIIANWYNPAYARLYQDVNLPRQIRNILDGVHYGTGPSPVNLSRGTMASYIPVIGRTLDNKLLIPWTRMIEDIQFNRALGFIRDITHEGNLLINHRLGQDITDPLVRRRIATNANAITQYANTALRQSQRGWQRNVFTSSAYTRAQFELIGQVMKAVNPASGAHPVERILAAQMALSLSASVLLVGKFVNDLVGLEDFEFNPGKPGFGFITVRDPLSPGQTLRIQMFPQITLARAVARSAVALGETALGKSDVGELPRRIGREFATAAMGRMGMPLPQAGMNLIGAGFQEEAGFTLGALFGERDISLRSKFINISPAPPVLSAAFGEGARDGKFIGIPSPLEIAGEAGGLLIFDEPAYASRDRARDALSQEKYGKPYSELTNREKQQIDADERVAQEVRRARQEAVTLRSSALAGVTLANEEERARYQERARSIDAQVASIGGRRARAMYDQLEQEMYRRAQQRMEDPAVQAEIARLEKLRQGGTLSPADQAALDYYAIFDRPGMKDPLTGGLDFDAYNAALTEWAAKWPQYSKEDSSPSKPLSPGHAELKEARKALAPYWQAEEEAYQLGKKLLNELPPGDGRRLVFSYSSLDDFRRDVEGVLRREGYPEGQIPGLRSQIEKNMGLTNLIEAYRKATIALDPALIVPLDKWYGAPSYLWEVAGAAVGAGMR